MSPSNIKSELISLDTELAEKEADILVVLPISFQELLAELDRSRLCSWGQLRAFKKEFSTALDGLLAAQYQEELVHFQRRLLASLGRMKLRYQKYNLNPDHYSAQHCLSFFSEVCGRATPNFYAEHLHDYENLMFKFECLRQLCSSEQQAGIQKIEMQIFSLLRESDEQSFQQQQKLIEQQIRSHPAFIDPSVFNVSSLVSVCENHINFFVDIRKMYLPAVKTISQRVKKYRSLSLALFGVCIVGVVISHRAFVVIPALLLFTLTIKLFARQNVKVMKARKRVMSSVGR